MFDGQWWSHLYVLKASAVIALAVLTGQPLQGWSSHPGPPSQFKGMRACSNRAPIHWQVSVADGELRVNQATRRPTTTPEISFPEGRLVGLDEGEWGGSLRWFKRGQTRGRDLLSENVVALVPASERAPILVFTGLAHLDVDYGSVYTVRIVEGTPAVKKVADLGTMPLLVQSRPDGTVFLLTRHGLARIHANGRVVRLCDADFAFLHVNSLAVLSDDELYVGMGLFVARLERSLGQCEVSWFVKDDYESFSIEGQRCDVHAR